MASLTSKQKKIYNFLKSKPGYLKKSAVNIPVTGSSKDKKIALTKAKAYFKKNAVKISNEKFESSEPAKKRIQIAKDVIKQLNVGKIIAKTGTYFSSRTVEKKVSKLKEPEELQELLKGAPACKVCGIGSLFICDIIRNDKYVVDPDNEGLDVDGDVIAERFSGIFDPSQLDLIETAFEARVMFDRTNTLRERDYLGWSKNTSVANTAIAFGKKYRNTQKRLVAIMENIIKNKGTFTP